MKYTNLGNTHLQVSRFCLGTMNFGVKTEEKEAFRIMDAALEAGINFFDTGNNYGKFIGQEGITESIIGNWFAQGNGRRERVILTTKVYEDMGDAMDGPNTAPGLSRYKIRRHFESSLKRLRTDHLEVYFMHHFDRQMNWDEVVDAFDNLICQGRVDYMATSNFPGWALADLAALAREKKIFGAVCEQHRYNLLCRLPELELIPSVRHHGMGLLPYSPLAGGMLKANNPRLTGEETARAQKFAALCAELGESVETVALAWVLRNPAVTAPILGPSTLEQFQNSLRALEIVLSDEICGRIDTIFPGPGEAPESYAW